MSNIDNLVDLEWDRYFSKDHYIKQLAIEWAGTMITITRGRRHHLCLQGVRPPQRQEPLPLGPGALVVEENGVLAGNDDVFVLLRDGDHGAGPLHRLLTSCF